MPNAPKPAPPLSEADVARYAVEMCGELMRLAQAHPNLRTLRYLFDMARVEAERRIVDTPPTSPR